MKNLFLAAVAYLSFATAASAAWSDFVQVPNSNSALLDAPSVVIDGTGRIHVLGRSKGDALWQTWSSDGGKTWKAAGADWRLGVLKLPPACVAPNKDSFLDCYGITTDWSVVQINGDLQKNGSYSWKGYMNYGGKFWSVFAVLAPAPDQRMIAGIGPDERTFSTKLWHKATGWKPWEGIKKASPKGWGFNTGCDAVAGKETAIGNSTFTDYDYLCVTTGDGGSTTVISGRVGTPQGLAPSIEHTDYVASALFAPAVIATKSSSTAFSKVGLSADVYMVDKKGVVLKGTYVVGSGWNTKPTPLGATRTFKSALSCDSGNASGRVKAVCAGHGIDGSIWFMVDK
jgi:hypothetical protein